MKKSKHWLCTFFLLLFAGLFGYMALNYYVDPLGYFTVKKGKEYYRSSTYTRAIKSEYLMKHAEQYDAVVLGGSKSGVLNAELLSEYSGKRYYNFYSDVGNFTDYLAYANYLVEKVGISEITLHLSSFEVGETRAESSNILQIPAIVNGTWFDRVTEFFSYLLTDPATLRNNWGKGKKTAYMDLVADGVRNRLHDYNLMKKNQEKHVKNYVTKNMNAYLKKLFRQDANSLTEYETGIDSIRQIKALCDAHGVTLNVVIGASFVAERYSYECDRYYDFLHALVTITDVWDFSDFNDVNRNPYNFVNRKHYTGVLGDLMIRTMYGKDAKEGFGIYLTKDHIEEYLKERKEKYQALKQEFETTGTIQLLDMEDDSYVPLT